MEDIDMDEVNAFNNELVKISFEIPPLYIVRKKLKKRKLKSKLKQHGR